MSYTRYICLDCVENDELSEYFEDVGEPGECSYCSKEVEQVVPLADFLGFIEDCIRSEYANPEDGLGWEDGEYIEGAHSLCDSYDMVVDILELGTSAAFEDITGYLSDYQWYQKNFYGPTDTEELTFTWDNFKKQVLQRSRYVFLIDEIRENSWGLLPEPSTILPKIHSSLSDVGLISTLREGTKLVRSRASRKKKFIEPSDLCTPSATDAIYPNRFSPAGIPMFYGSEDEETCIAEISKDKSSIYSVATWITQKPLTIVDFTDKFDFDFEKGRHFCPTYPSIFQQGRANLRPYYGFLLYLANDLSKPIDKSDRQHIDYVPTQIITEYLRRAKREDFIIEGICYSSSKNGKKNFVLFAEKDECIETGLGSGKTPILRMKKRSVHHIKYRVPLHIRLDRLYGLIKARFGSL